MNRRRLLATGLGALAAPALGASAPARSRPLRVTLLGQALIEHAATSLIWPGRDALAARLSRADICFTNLETVIRGPRAEGPTREPQTLHAGEPAVLETLKSVGVNLVATSNNHAFDLGSGGILDTVSAVERAGIAFAGSGPDLAAAAAPGVRQTPAGAAALVAFATGKVREGGRATAAHPGVNALRRDASGAPLAQDLDRILDAIADARRRADVVIAYQHNHDWEPDMAEVPAWQRRLARRCVDAGASLFAGHGAPVVQGMERYNGAPLFYGLGNFIFQTEKPPGAYPAQAWRGVFVETAFVSGRLTRARLVPIVLNEVGLDGPLDMATRGFPALAQGAERRLVLRELRTRGAALESRLAVRSDGEVVL